MNLAASMSEFSLTNQQPTHPASVSVDKVLEESVIVQVLDNELESTLAVQL